MNDTEAGGHAQGTVIPSTVEGDINIDPQPDPEPDEGGNGDDGDDDTE